MLICEILQGLVGVIIVLIPFLLERISEKVKRNKIIFLVIGVVLIGSVITEKILDYAFQEQKQTDIYHFLTPLYSRNIGLLIEVRMTFPPDSFRVEYSHFSELLGSYNFYAFLVQRMHFSSCIEIEEVVGDNYTSTTYEIKNLFAYHQEMREKLRPFADMFFSLDSSTIEDFENRTTGFIINKWDHKYYSTTVTGCTCNDSLVGFKHGGCGPRDATLPQSLYELEHGSIVLLYMLVHRNYVDIEIKDAELFQIASSDMMLLGQTNGCFRLGCVQDTTIVCSDKWSCTKIIMFAHEPEEHFCVPLD